MRKTVLMDKHYIVKDSNLKDSYHLFCPDGAEKNFILRNENIIHHVGPPLTYIDRVFIKNYFEL